MFLLKSVLLLKSVEVIFGLIGGQPLSPTEISVDKYGAGVFAGYGHGHGDWCACVWLKNTECYGPVDCRSFANPDGTEKINLLGKLYTAAQVIPPVKTCPGSRTYQSIPLVSNVNLPASPKLPPENFLIPPAGTECRVLGFAGSRKSPLFPNKIDTKIVNFEECKEAWKNANSETATRIKDTRHFCAFLVKRNTPLPVDIYGGDSTVPIFCKPWWKEGENGGSSKWIWPILSEDDEEDEISTGFTVFAGFQYLYDSKQNVPLVFESPTCPEGD